MAFYWTDEAETALSVAYLGGETSALIAARLGIDRRVVSRKVSKLGLNGMLSPAARLARKRHDVATAQTRSMAAREARGQFIWTADREAELRRRYGVEMASAGEIAQAMGCSQKSVSRKVCDLGLSALRGPQARLADTLRGAAQGRAALAATRAGLTPSNRVAVPDAELIAAFLAAGRVTQLPPGHACGITRWEGLLRTALPPRPSAEAIAEQKRCGQAAHAARAARALTVTL